MSDTTIEERHTQGDPHPHEGAHPTEKQYVVIALILAGLTAVEVVLYYITSLPHALLIAMLGILAIAKFGIVVAYFMHLKFDSRVFRGLFITGLVLALAVYVVALSTFHVWSGGMPHQSTP